MLYWSWLRSSNHSSWRRRVCAGRLMWLPIVFLPCANWFRNRAMPPALKNLRVSHAQHQPPRVTRTDRVLATIVAHFQCVNHPQGKFSFFSILFPNIFPNISKNTFQVGHKSSKQFPRCQNFKHEDGASGPLIRMRQWSSRNCMTSQRCKRRKHELTFLMFPSVKFCESLHS